MNKLLLEETLFETAADFVDVEEGETEEIPTEENEEESPEVEDTLDTEITNDNLDQVVADAEGGEPPMEPATTTYKVTFTLGNHTNWSRVDATNEEDAKQQVTDYVTKKWSDRTFEITDVGKFEEMEESLNNPLKEGLHKIYVNGELLAIGTHAEPYFIRTYGRLWKVTLRKFLQLLRKYFLLLAILKEVLIAFADLIQYSYFVRRKCAEQEGGLPAPAPAQNSNVNHCSPSPLFS